MKGMRNMTVIFSLLIVIVVLSSICVPKNREAHANRIINFSLVKVRWDDPNVANVLLGLTLIVLLWYAWNTFKIAKVSEERWKRDSMIRATYSMEMASNKDTVFFAISNPSSLLVRALVNCNFRVYGDLIDYADPYNGKAIWEIFPVQISRGHFEISVLLSKKGRTIAQMKAERTPANFKEQLTMDLEIKFTDETGKEKRLPGRKHFFDFDRDIWIPEITV